MVICEDLLPIYFYDLNISVAFVMFRYLIVLDDELLHKPGSIFLYTTYGFTLLSAVLETVMDKPFHEYILDFVRQMGLNHTLPEPTPKSREFVFNRMPCYLYDPKKG